LLIHDSAGSQSATRKLLLQTDLVQIELDCVLSKFAARAFRSSRYNGCIIDSLENGIQLLEASLQVSFTAPIIMVVADRAPDVLAAMRLGAADCLIRDTITARALEVSICVVIESARCNEYEAECARRYLSLVEHSHEIMYTHDLQGNSPFINRTGEQVTNYSREDLERINFRQLISPDCVDTVWWTIARMLAERKPSSCKMFMMSKEGRRIPVSVTMHLVYREGNPVGVQGIARELSWGPEWLPVADSAQMESFLL